MPNAKWQRKKGVTLIEILVDFAILAIVGTAVLSAFSASFKSIELAKAKIAAVALANEKIEELRNMPYDDLATEYGPIYPPGDITDTQLLTRKGINFSVGTVISYVDDPYDGDALGATQGKPQDFFPYDYKKIEVTVSRQGSGGYLSRLSSNVAARAAETASDTGIVRICVIDSEGVFVPEATVTIKNLTVTPAVDISAVTSATDGCIMVPNLPPDSHNHYKLSAMKDGYSTDATSDRTPQNPHAIQPDVNVMVQQVTNQTFIIDRLSAMTITVVDGSGNPLANNDIDLEGEKLLYSNPETHKYSQPFTTDVEGKVRIEQLEFDNYTIVVDGKMIAATSPYQPVLLGAAEDLDILIVTADSTSVPIIVSANPVTAKSGESFSLSIDGNYFSNPSIKIIGPSSEEINGTDVTVSHHGNDYTIEAEFDLAEAATGLWDILVTNSTGHSTRQIHGLEVTN